MQPRHPHFGGNGNFESKNKGLATLFCKGKIYWISVVPVVWNDVKILENRFWLHRSFKLLLIDEGQLCRSNSSSTMPAVLINFGPPEAAATAKLFKMDTFFDCLNVRSLVEHKAKRKKRLETLLMSPR